MLFLLLAKLKLFWTKAYLWVGLAGVILLMVLLFWRRKVTTESPTPMEVDTLKQLAEGIKNQMTKASNDAQVKIIKAQATDQAIHEQVDQITKMDNELDKAKLLIAIRKTQTGKA